ncbi:peptidase C39 family protein [Glutamicibacter sp.]|uniref:peptidase C39 family protein n=1 Tax=Glutamicibacter sp. TaxID=1931995 RepID=UPI002B48A69C|nr:peptidase C39 family protein [Glutamicibacter sp.]HJX79291.1 peptidase C39 family protein [Glutamicibacter sp.]
MAQRSAQYTRIQDFDPEHHPAQLRHLSSVPGPWESRVATVNARLLTIQSSDATVTGAALLTARSAAAYVKISGILARDAATYEELVRAVLDYAKEKDLACVKWEGWTEEPWLADLAEQMGFQSLPAPRGTADGSASIPRFGYVHWLHPACYLPTAHYEQSENFTCAAVAALAAHGETTSIATMDRLRSVELLLWRQATNFMACEPVGLGLAIAERWPASRVQVSLDTDKPVIVDYYPEAERSWRGILQAESRRRAEATGLPVTSKRMEISQIHEAVSQSARVLLLVSLRQMLGYDVPHWILCHGTAGSTEKPVIIIDDSWIDAPSGESWVDVTCLPIPLQELDSMSCLEADGYRAALILTDCFSE